MDIPQEADALLGDKEMPMTAGNEPAGLPPAGSDTETEGRRAARLLDDPALASAFERLESGIVAAWRSSAVDQADAREWLYLRLAAVAALRDELRVMVEQGMLAERERLRHEREGLERKAKGFVPGEPP